VSNIFGFLNDMGNYQDRVVGRYDSPSGHLMVSTARVSDGRDPIETAVRHPDYNDGEIVIVESYITDKTAKEGHVRWVRRMTKSKLPKALVDCCNSEVQSILASMDDQIRYPRQRSVT
jgi:hypothetical protein